MNKNSFDQAWEEIHSKRIWGGYPTEYVIRFIARNYYNELDRSKIKILDYGCGAGAHTWYLAREGFDTYAFDGSQSAVKNTKRRLEDDNLRAHMICEDALNLPYKANFFDAVVDNVSIQANLINDIKFMYKDCYRMLKPYGKIFTSVFGRKTGGYGTGHRVEEGTYENLTEGRLQHSGRRHFFEEEELKEILMNSGFSKVIVDSILYTDMGEYVHQLVGIAEKME